MSNMSIRSLNDKRCVCQNEIGNDDGLGRVEFVRTMQNFKLFVILGHGMIYYAKLPGSLAQKIHAMCTYI